jgi:NDP-sugar pyrophosphorylase family protein
MLQSTLIRELTPRYFFDNPFNFPFKDIFNKAQFVWELLTIKDQILKNMEPTAEEATIEDGARVIGQVHVGKGTIVHTCAVIRGPVWIGENCSIRDHALIRGNSVIGDNCVVGHGAEVKNSLLMNNVKMQGVYAGDSILGAYSRVSSGSVFENRKFDQSEIVLKPFKYTLLPIDEAISTGRKFLGCVLGDYSRLGGVSTTFPGTLIGKHTWIYGNQHIGQMFRFIPSFKMVKEADDQSTWSEHKPFMLESGFDSWEHR